MHPRCFSGTGHARQVRILNFTRGSILLACIADYNFGLLLIAAQQVDFIKQQKRVVPECINTSSIAHLLRQSATIMANRCGKEVNRNWRLSC
jgi:hypothetical protein